MGCGCKGNKPKLAQPTVKSTVVAARPTVTVTKK
jgi:hypothetical protein